MKVSEIMTGDVITIDRNRSLKDATELMQKNKVSKLVVVKEKKMAGVLTYKDITKTLGSVREKVSPAHLHVAGAFSDDPVTVTPDTDIKAAAALMLKHNISSLPVVEKDELKGIITKTDLIKTIKSKEQVKTMMIKPICVSPDDRIIHALKVIADYDISSVPVVKDNQLTGVISRKELSLAMENFREHIDKQHQNARLENLVVSSVMKPEPQTATPKMTLTEAAEIMAKHRLSGLPVSENGKLVGIITKTDLIKAI